MRERLQKDLSADDLVNQKTFNFPGLASFP